jgi:integrase
MPTLTDPAIRSAQPPPTGAQTIWDSSLKGFGLRISSGGAKTFIVLIASGRRQAIGRYGPGGISLSDARTEAKKILANKTLGRIRPTHVAFDDAKDEFLTERTATLRPRTLDDYKRLLAKHYPYGRSSVGSVTARAILNRLSKLPPSERHHAFAAGRAFFKFCVSQHYIDRSPMEGMEPPPGSPSRKRVLSDDELRAVYKTAIEGTATFHRIIALCILTGQRRGEIAKLRREWRNGEKITLPPEVTKNKRVHAFPIGKSAQRVLDTTPRLSDTYYFPAARDRVKGKPATVFNGWAKPKADLDEELAGKGYAVAPWRIHDLRRTVATALAALGVPQVVVEKLLNHVSGGSQSQIAQVYNVYAYFDEMRDAVVKWEAKLTTLLNTPG